MNELNLNEQFIESQSDLSKEMREAMLAEARRIMATTELAWWRDTNAMTLSA